MSSAAIEGGDVCRSNETGKKFLFYHSPSPGSKPRYKHIRMVLATVEKRMISNLLIKTIHSLAYFAFALTLNLVVYRILT